MKLSLTLSVLIGLLISINAEYVSTSYNLANNKPLTSSIFTYVTNLLNLDKRRPKKSGWDEFIYGFFDSAFKF